ncbi:endo alpha-1,4 polygalactosaminidase precursor [Botrytis cinerea]
MSSGGIFKTPLTSSEIAINTPPMASKEQKPVNPHKIFTRKCNIILGLIALFLLAIGLALGLTFGLRHHHSSPPASTPTTTPSNPYPPTNASYWTPNLNASNTWNIELLAALDPANIYANTTIYDIDLFLAANTTPPIIRTLHSQSHKVICYFSAGTIETYRPDTNRFLPSDYGKQLPDWPNEYWANISSPNVRSIMQTRLDLAVNQSCDAVDPDNVDGYSNDNGLKLTEDDSIDYMQWLAAEAHGRGLGIGLKNAGEIIDRVLDNVQFAVNEQCVQYQECDTWQAFIDNGKPVFNIEYPKDAPKVSEAEKQEFVMAQTYMRMAFSPSSKRWSWMIG